MARPIEEMAEGRNVGIRNRAPSQPVDVGRCRLGFPTALVLAWALELTPEGIRRTPAEPPERVAAEKQEAGLSRAGKPHDSERVQDTIEDRPCVVVLPFSNLGGEPENEYFSDGVTEADVASRRR